MRVEKALKIEACKQTLAFLKGKRHTNLISRFLNENTEMEEDDDDSRFMTQQEMQEYNEMYQRELLEKVKRLPVNCVLALCSSKNFNWFPHIFLRRCRKNSR